MATGTLVSINEYLSTSYAPDCDYIDGVLEERNLGEHDHAWLQTLVVAYFMARRKQWNIRPVVEQRVQVSPTSFRVPDVCVLLGDHRQEQIIRTPPLICVEILSPEDRLSRLQERMTDYLSFGVPYVFLLDPQTRKAFRWTTAGMTEVPELRTESPEMVVPLGELFE